MFRSYDLTSANAKGGQAGWEEQNYQVWDHFAASNRFVLSDMWIGFPNATFVEVGFKRTPSCNGNCFFRARRTTSGHTSLVINKAPQGAHTWHNFKYEYSSGSGGWVVSIDGQSYGTWGGVATSATRMTVGIELTSNCSVAHTTYFGSPSTSSTNAFRYKTGSGLWTTWGSGNRSCDGILGCNDPNAHASWLTYAIYGRAWADGWGGY